MVINVDGADCCLIGIILGVTMKKYHPIANSNTTQYLQILPSTKLLNASIILTLKYFKYKYKYFFKNVFKILLQRKQTVMCNSVSTLTVCKSKHQKRTVDIIEQHGSVLQLYHTSYAVPPAFLVAATRLVLGLKIFFNFF